jgi:hypothetical protein
MLPSFFIPPYLSFISSHLSYPSSFLSVLRFPDFYNCLSSFPILSSLSLPILLSSFFFKSDLLWLRDRISSHVLWLLLGPHIQHSEIKLDACADLFLFVERDNLIWNVKLYFTVYDIFKFSDYFRTLNRFVWNI